MITARLIEHIPSKQGLRRILVVIYGIDKCLIEHIPSKQGLRHYIGDVTLELGDLMEHIFHQNKD